MDGSPLGLSICHPQDRPRTAKHPSLVPKSRVRFRFHPVRFIVPMGPDYGSEQGLKFARAPQRPAGVEVDSHGEKSPTWM